MALEPSSSAQARGTLPDLGEDLRHSGTADEQRQASWRVEDLASELAELRSIGVEIIELDTPELKTENGIVDTATRCTPGSWILPRAPSESISTSEVMLASVPRRFAPPTLVWRGRSV